MGTPRRSRDHALRISGFDLAVARTPSFRGPRFGLQTCVGHQCRFEVDYPKPTRLFSNIPGMQDFGPSGWPSFHPDGSYSGPLPHCGHNHKGKTDGQNAKGEFGSSSKAAYPPLMCKFKAIRIIKDAENILARPKAGEVPHQATASSASDALPRQERVSKFAVWGSLVADRFQSTRGSSSRGF